MDIELGSLLMLHESVHFRIPYDEKLPKKYYCTASIYEEAIAYIIEHRHFLYLLGLMSVEKKRSLLRSNDFTSEMLIIINFNLSTEGVRKYCIIENKFGKDVYTEIAPMGLPKDNFMKLMTRLNPSLPLCSDGNEMLQHYCKSLGFDNHKFYHFDKNTFDLIFHSAFNQKKSIELSDYICYKLNSGPDLSGNSPFF